MTDGPSVLLRAPVCSRLKDGRADMVRPATGRERCAQNGLHGCWSAATIGIEKENYYFTHAALEEALAAALPNAKFMDTTRLVKWQRIVKSPQEIEYMQATGKIVAAMHQRVSEVLRPGVKQSDVVAEIYHTGTRGVDGYWGDYPAAVPIIGAGSDASAPHLTWSDRLLQANESIFFELAGVHKRYHCPLSRTFYLGKPDQKFLDAEKAILEGMEAGLTKAVPGNSKLGSHGPSGGPSAAGACSRRLATWPHCPARTLDRGQAEAPRYQQAREPLCPQISRSWRANMLPSSGSNPGSSGRLA